MTRYEAFVEKEWRTTGMARVVVARTRADGSAEIGCFLLDVWCLGVKDAFLVGEIPPSEHEAMLANMLPEDLRERIHPACARKLIEGAAAYAQSLGFAPARDFRKARHVLGGLETCDCAEEFTFGRNGRPCFVEGPDEPDGRVQRVLAVLTARFGAGGFDYVMPPAESRDDDVMAVREELMDFLDCEPEAVPRFFEFSGMVAALQVCPGVVMPTRLMEALWGPAGREWEDEEEAQWFADALKHYWNDTVELMACEAKATPETAWPIDVSTEECEDKEHLALALVDWCHGFIQTVELWPEAWGDATARAGLAPHWDVLRAWADPEKPGSIDMLEKTEGPNALATAVVALYRALRPAKPV